MRDIIFDINCELRNVIHYLWDYGILTRAQSTELEDILLSGRFNDYIKRILRIAGESIYLEQLSDSVCSTPYPISIFRLIIYKHVNIPKTINTYKSVW